MRPPGLHALVSFRHPRPGANTSSWECGIALGRRRSIVAISRGPGSAGWTWLGSITSPSTTRASTRAWLGAQRDVARWSEAYSKEEITLLEQAHHQPLAVHSGMLRSKIDPGGGSDHGRLRFGEEGVGCGLDAWLQLSLILRTAQAVAIHVQSSALKVVIQRQLQAPGPLAIKHGWFASQDFKAAVTFHEFTLVPPP